LAVGQNKEEEEDDDDDEAMNPEVGRENQKRKPKP
jgi:hypothetical protein